MRIKMIAASALAISLMGGAAFAQTADPQMMKNQRGAALFDQGGEFHHQGRVEVNGPTARNLDFGTTASIGTRPMVQAPVNTSDALNGQSPATGLSNGSMTGSSVQFYDNSR